MRGKRWIALLAAAAGLAILIGTAYAGRSATAKPEKGVQFALVDNDGTLLKGSKDVVSVAHPGTGQYEITMKNVVTYCALTGSFHGGTGLVGFSLPDVNIVHVNTRTLIGNDANAEFSVVMAC